MNAAAATRAPHPWATLAGLALAALTAVWPVAAAALIYDRTAILAGEVWRGATGHFVHFGASHLAWDVLVTLLAGAWVESLAPRRARWYWATAPLVIGAVLLAGDPALERFGGLSGVATGLVVLLATELGRRPGRDRAFAFLLSLLVLAKLAAELGGWGGLAKFDDPAVQSVPLAHLAGVAWAGVVALVRRRVLG